jgi:hypothetical protein
MVITGIIILLLPYRQSMLQTDSGDKKNNTLGVKWLRKAAWEEHRKAQELLKENKQTW